MLSVNCNWVKRIFYFNTFIDRKNIFEYFIVSEILSFNFITLHLCMKTNPHLQFNCLKYLLLFSNIMSFCMNLDKSLAIYFVLVTFILFCRIMMTCGVVLLFPNSVTPFHLNQMINGGDLHVFQSKIREERQKKTLYI